MALINCKECGKEISDMAKMCPHCGCLIKKKGKGFAVASFVLGLFSCFYTLVLCMNVFLSLIFADMITPAAEQSMQFTIRGVSSFIIITSILAFIFGFISHKIGYKGKEKNVGIIISIISIAIFILISIIF